VVPSTNRPVRVLAAPDKFRGTATALEVCAAIEVAVFEAGGHCRKLPLADGGEGTLNVFGGGNRMTQVGGPLGSMVDARWSLEGQQAVIEMAEASGLLVAGGPTHNDPMQATTRGTGQLIATAMQHGATRILVGLGGSATTDGGIGAVEALLNTYTLSEIKSRNISVCVDVNTRFLDAATVFAAQKGASSAQIYELSMRLGRVRETYLQQFGVDVENIIGSGAAGGLAGGLAALGCRIVPGFDTLAKIADLDGAMYTADLVVTGEGKFDAQSLRGKVVGGVIDRSGSRPVLVVCGAAERGVTVPPNVTVLPLLDTFGRDLALNETTQCITAVVAQALSS